MTPAAIVRDFAAFSLQVGLVVVSLAVLMKLVQVPARARYLCLRLALIACLALPWLLAPPQPVVPADVATMAVAPVTVDQQQVASFVDGKPASMPAIDPARSIRWSEALLAVLLFGVVVRALWLAIGLLRLRQLRQGAAVVDVPEYTDIQQRLGTRATIAQVAELSQPATFGVRRPVVLLPASLADAPPALRRAVVTHELFHVQRRDWLSVLGEEAVRTLLWFHPGVFWLTSNIQLAREEIVDELSVRITGDRRTYIRALLAFADGGGLRPAPAFAQRRQLFHRVVSVSTENVMSAPRFVISAGVLVAAVLGTAWYGSTLFPTVSAAAIGWKSLAESHTTGDLTTAGHAAARAGAIFTGQQLPPGPPSTVPVDKRTGEAVTPHAVTPENPIPRRIRATAAAWPSQFEREQTAVVVSGEVTLDRDGRVISVVRSGCSMTTAGAEPTCRAFFDAAAAAIRQWRYERPVQAPLQFTVATTFRPGSAPIVAQFGGGWSELVREAQESLRVLADNTRGTAFARQPDQSTEAFLRAQLAELTSRYREVERAQRLALERLSPAHPDVVQVQQQLALLNDQLARLQEELRAAETEALKTKEAELEVYRAQVARIDAERPRPMIAPSGKIPLRVGGAVAPPRVLVSTKPFYTPEAMAARVEGTVVLEVLVDEAGAVPDARVLRSIPLLDQAALDTVKQWRFAPAVLKGEAVPVIVQVEMHFALK